MRDLPIGVDPRGFDAWNWQDTLAAGVTVGAPPDEYNTRGQDWGLPPFAPHKLRAADYLPFRETIRAGLRHAGGLRIDHVMGLFRLWWVPRGAGPAGGAYVRSFADELLEIVAIESQRSGAMIVGEDLGTVAPGVRARLARHRILSYRLLWFEKKPPSRYPAQSLAAVTTHDLPTIAGLWTGADLAEQDALGLAPNRAGTLGIRRRLGKLTGAGKTTSTADVVVRTHRLLAAAASALVTPTLEDALAVEARPNMPGTTVERPNWSIPLPLPLEEIERHPLVLRVARCFRERSSRTGGPADGAARAVDAARFGPAGELYYRVAVSLLILLAIGVLRRFAARRGLPPHRERQRALPLAQGHGLRRSSSSAVLAVGGSWFRGVQSLSTFFGLLTAGIAIALRDPLVNLAGWAFLMWRRPFDVGDRIEVGGHRGDVIDLRIFQFSLLEIGNWVDADQTTGRIINIPNGKVFTESLANYTKGFDFIWHELPVLVTFESDWEKAKGLLGQIAERHGASFSESAERQVKAAASRYLIFFTRLTPIVYTSVQDCGVLLTVRYLTEPKNRRVTAEAIWEDILREFGRHDDIDFAYPTQRFYDNRREGKPGAHAAGDGVRAGPGLSS